VRALSYPTATAFLDAVRPVLAEHEAEHHLVLGVAEAFAADPRAGGRLFAATVEADDGLALAAWMVGPRPLLLASDRDDVSPAADALADLLGERGLDPRRVIGTVGQVERFIEAWSRHTTQSARVAMRQRSYRLDAVESLPAVSGCLRGAVSSDLELVASWIHAFEEEALGALSTPTPSAARAVAEHRIAAGEIHLWCDPDPRTMAGSARPTSHGVAVNAVYTPPEWRRRGYATACVAELSRRLLGSGFQFCVLYTDLSNPTSNAIYTRIGYRPVRDFLMYELDT